MQTTRWTLDSQSIDATVIGQAADILRRGGLVAFPTETVYGLGCDGLSEPALENLFAAKGRPATNPVILHVADRDAAKSLARIWPDFAEKLTAALWPGPLTVVVPKADHVPHAVTANGETVAIRCPNHPVALALLRTVGGPLAAPSANRSTELSPTRADHVASSLSGVIDGILDGGPCSVGIESTVVDCTGKRPKILRPGSISSSTLEAIVGPVDTIGPSAGPARSPGQMTKHYAPKTPIVLVDSPQVAFDKCLADQSRGVKSKSVGLNDGTSLADYLLPDSPAEYAARLYEFLHEIDASGEVDRLVIELPRESPDWAGVRDRLHRAAGVTPVVFVPREVKQERRVQGRRYR